MKRATRRSDSPEKTEEMASAFGSALRPGDVIGLTGDLGSGKTCFVRGLARGLGVDEQAIGSPSFVMIAEHWGRLPLYHIDLYRLDPAQADVEALREYLYGGGVSAVEWVERLPAGALSEFVEVRLTPVAPNVRRIDFAARGERAERLLGQVVERIAGWAEEDGAGQ